MATRRIVKVRRQQPSSAPSNPFSAMRFTTSDSSVQASIPVSVPPPSHVMIANVKTVARVRKLMEGRNGTVKDALSTKDKNTDSTEVAKIQKDEAALKESDGKEEDTVDGTGEDKVVVGEPKANNRKRSGIEGKTADGDTDEKKVNEDGDADEISNYSAEKREEAESRMLIIKGSHHCRLERLLTWCVGTGFSGSLSFSIGSAPKESTNAPFPSFNIGCTNNGSSAPALATAAGAPKKFAMPEVAVETGEENEEAVFTADSVMYEYLDGGWNERGKGELKLNIPVSGGERPRLIMRAKGNYRLILNASLYDDMSLKDMDKKGMTFACINSISESPSRLTSFALKFKDTGIREDFEAAVEAHKALDAPKALSIPFARFWNGG